MALVGATALTAVAGLAIAPSAHAQEISLPPGVSDVVAFSACAQDTGVNLLSNTGTYTFDSTNRCGQNNLLGGVCEGVSDGDIDTTATTVVLPQIGACSIHVNGNGTFNNIVCGTGTTGGGAFGTDSATITETDGSTETVRYGIVFVAGLGVITGTGTAGSDAGGTVLGVVQITPVNGDCGLLSGPVTTFLATGIAAITEPGLLGP